jgi:hypothetical protein
VPTPVFRLIVFVLAHAFQVTDVDATNTLLDTSFDDVFGETVEEVRSTLRPLLVQTGGSVTTRVVAFGYLFEEVVPVLFQPIPGIQVGVLGTVRNGGEVADAEVDTCCLVAGRGGCLDLVLADEV